MQKKRKGSANPLQELHCLLRNTYIFTKFLLFFPYSSILVFSK